MTQGVWSIVWQLEVKRLQPQLNHCSQTRNCEWLKRRLQPQENLAKICLWTRLAQFYITHRDLVERVVLLLKPNEKSEGIMPPFSDGG